MKAIDLTNQTFGRLTAIRCLPERTEHGACVWLFQCQCGKTTTMTTGNFRSGTVFSCGCLQIETAGEQTKTHGLSNTPEYHIWSTLKQRITNSKCKDYPNYGGRGIKLYPNWNDSFTTFIADMGQRPGEGYSIERIDNDGDYTPSNCHWATAIEQANNKSNSLLVEYQGKLKTVAQIAREANVSYEMLRRRIHRGQTASYAILKMTPNQPTQRYRWKRRGGYECSTVGDRRFSALNACMSDGRTIEMHYQCDVKGYDIGGTNWRLGKGKPPLEGFNPTYEQYKALWATWAKANPELMRELATLAQTKDSWLSDCFASTPVSQAHALCDLLNEGY